MTINEQLHNSAFHKGHEAACPVCTPNNTMNHYDFCPHCGSERRASEFSTTLIKRTTTCLDCGYMEVR